MYSNRLFLLLLACMTSIFSVLAEPITQEQARQKAERYLAKRSGSRKLAAVVNKKKLSPIRATSTQQEATYYAFNRGDNEGFVLVAAEDRGEGVLGDGEEERVEPRQQLGGEIEGDGERNDNQPGLG